MLEKWKVSEDQKKKLRNLKLEGPCLDSIELKKKKIERTQYMFHYNKI